MVVSALLAGAPQRGKAAARFRPERRTHTPDRQTSNHTASRGTLNPTNSSAMLTFFFFKTGPVL